MRTSMTTRSALEVLESEALRAGVNSIQRIDSVSGVGVPKEFRLYECTVESFSRRVNDYLLLRFGASHDNTKLSSDDHVSDDEIRVIQGVLIELHRCDPNGQVFCFSDDPRDMETPLVFGSTEVRFSPVAGLFHRLLELPKAFNVKLKQKGGSDFARGEHNDRHQNREGLLKNVPEGSGAPGASGDTIRVDEYLRDWARSGSRRHPLLLLGDRGSGKTWELFHFCDLQYKRHLSEPWIHGPAVFLYLGELRTYFTEAALTVPGFTRLILNQYPDVRVRWHAGMLEALIGAGQLVLCLDGVDEIQIQPTDKQVKQHIRSLSSSLPFDARFIMACRTTHFGSLNDLLELETWPGHTIRNSFEVLELTPLDEERVHRIIDTAAPDLRVRRAADLAESLASFSANTRVALSEALVVASQHPALLAVMLNRRVDSNQRSPALEVLERALDDAVLEFNLDMERTTDIHVAENGEELDLTADYRKDLMSEIAWYMAERGLDEISSSALPRRLAVYFGLSGDALERDIRSQTLFELSSFDSNSVTAGGMRFTLRPTAELVCKTLAGPKRHASRMADITRNGEAALLDTAVRRAPCAATSVSGAYFLARYIVDRVLEARDVSPETPEAWLRWLGRVPLSPMSGAMLAEMLRKADSTASERAPLLTDLASSARRLVRTLAQATDFSVFSAWYRYLGHNLSVLGAVSPLERDEIDPWEPGIVDLVRGPTCIPGYEMVLIPPPSSQVIEQRIADIEREFGPLADGLEEVGRPFLMGVHEVTNGSFDLFCSGDEGWDWRTERMTSAGSQLSVPPSRYSQLSNEYHLYAWSREEVDEEYRFHPDIATLRHPVAYVSWFAASAFCDWVSRSEGLPSVVYSEWYDGVDSGRPRSNQCAIAYRLPTAREWWWAAQGGSDAAKFPWDLSVFLIPPAVLEAWTAGGTGLSSSCQRTMRRITRHRTVAEQVLLGAGKAPTDVLTDDFTVFGTSGMLGNVKEWCHDALLENAEINRLVLGATAYQGRHSFTFSYWSYLYPRNTNPDIGFRLARSLSHEETDLLRDRERTLASISDTAASHRTNSL